MDLQTSTEFCEEHLEFARTVTKQIMSRFQVSPHFYDEYLSAAYTGLVEAANRYDTSAEVPFDKYAYLRVRGAVIDYIRQSSGFSAREYKAAQLLEASNCLAEDYQSFRMRINPKDIDQQLSEVLEFAARGAFLFRVNYLDSEEEVVESGEPGRNPEELMFFRDQAQGIKDAISSLSPRERIVIESFYYDGMTFQEIADNRLHVTRSWVSRMHSRAIQKLRKILKRKYEAQENEGKML